MKPRERLAAAGLAAAVLTGCGGGGGMGMNGAVMPMPQNEPPTPMPTTPMPTDPMPMNPPMNPMSAATPGEASVSTYLQTRHEATLKGQGGYTAQVRTVPSAKPGMFNGSGPAYSAAETLTVRGPALRVRRAAATRYFLASPYVPLGKVGVAGTPYGVVTGSFAFPTTLKVGDSGLVDNLTYYHNSSRNLSDAAEVTTYWVDATDAGTLRLCLNTVVSSVTAQGNADGLADGAETTCFAVNAAGTTSLESVSLAGDRGNLTFR